MQYERAVAQQGDQTALREEAARRAALSNAQNVALNASMMPVVEARLQAAFAASNSKPVVLEFYSKDCAHCRESSKRLHDVERAHPEVSWVMVDTQDESNRVLWERLGVDEIPHFAFLDAGKELRRTEVGPISTDRAEAGIRSVVIPGM